MAEEKILNEEQLKAVEHKKGPLLIIAGAGTGKTTVITERIKYLILKKNILPSQILALTFTEKAAAEMEERIDVIMPYGYTQMWISTFHAFCDRILRSEAIHIGLNPGYKLMTEAESILFLRKNLFKFKLEYFRPLGNPNKFLEGLLQHFSRLKDEDINSEQHLQYAQEISNFKHLPAGKAGQISNEKLDAKRYSLDANRDEIKKNLELAHAYQVYEELKIKESVMDFSDLISNTLKLFRTRKNILKMYQEQFRYILVDEFQDTNFAQNALATLLAGEKKNITVVGDDDQAIYRWRGAAISNIIQFKKQFPKVKIITLTKNYRSTEEILDTSYKLIQYNNPDRLEVKEKINKKLSSVRKIKGEKIEFIFANRVENEAEAVAKKIQDLVEKKNKKYKEIAILVRANDHSQSFTRTLEKAKIPYQFLGPGRLFHQEEIKDLIAYLKVIYNFEDSASLYRILINPIFNFESLEISALLNLAKRKNYTLFEALQKSHEIFLPEKTQEKIKKIVAMIKRHLSRVAKNTAGQILYYFLQDSGLLQKFFLVKTEKEAIKAQNVAKFFEKLKTYEAEHDDASVFAVIDWIDLSMEMGESPLATDIDWTDNDAVNILTVHSSKGLEFPVVFLVNLVAQRFPVRERKEQIPISKELIKEILPEGDYHLEEERRLFYVGMTRAKDNLFFTAANFYGEGKRERKISPFVFEALGEKNVLEKLNRQKLEKTFVQPSLLEWLPESTLIKPSTTSYKPLTNVTYLSYSQIQTFDICPLHYKLKYILKVPTPTSAAQNFGTSIHSSLRDFYQGLKQRTEVEKEDLLEILAKNWINEGYKSKEHELKSFATAKKILLHYYKNYFDPQKIPVALEHPFRFSLKKGKQDQSYLRIGGRIDRIDLLEEGKIEVIDYKTGNNLPSEKELIDDWQLTFYALAATEVKDEFLNKKSEEVILSLFYLEQGKKFSTTRTKKQLEEARKKILEKADEIAKSDFKCSGNLFCKSCEYKILCSQ